ncbi:site-specific integrase [Gordonia sp. ABSL49_1]|uniref:tyrosine-type recombinase/integrase n=1 Tax=Gordonia sp. ABSL49_1 TaxID=2920941 RepID=UPI001F0E096B|nr:site-specific integrase [Gordonia sp. ABSL49_1]MCH5645362.1 site-specific integrase [Gordonia sp. ABSL49_1]
MTKPKRQRREFGAIRKLPSGRFQAHYIGPDAAKHYAPKTFAAKVDAEAWLTDRRREIDKKLWNPIDADRAESPMFEPYADEWLQTRLVRGRPLKIRTRDHYRQLLDLHILPAFRAKRLDQITPADVRKWHDNLLPDAPTMRAHAYSLLRTIMMTAYNSELIVANPCRVEGAGSARRRSRTVPASVDELAVIVENMTPRYRLMVSLAAWCALRFGELIEIRRRDVMLEYETGDDGERQLVAGYVAVSRGAVRDAEKNAYIAQDSAKSDAGSRTVHIPPHVLDAVEHHLQEHTGPNRDALLFPAPEGGYLTPTTLYNHFHPARDAAKRPDLRFHDLRHTGAVLAAATGATLAELQQRLGHSTVSAAMRYQHAAQGRDRKIAEALSLLVKPDTPQE